MTIDIDKTMYHVAIVEIDCGTVGDMSKWWKENIGKDIREGVQQMKYSKSPRVQYSFWLVSAGCADQIFKN